MAKTVLEELHDLAKDEANRPGAVRWGALREACARELARELAGGAGGDELASGADGGAAESRALPSITITDDMIDRAIVASYTAAKPAPTMGTPQERLEVMRANERAQMTAALAAALGGQ